MKKLILFFAIFFVIVTIFSQNYTITFAAAGAASTVEIVKIENITQNTSLTMNGNDTLHLVDVIGIEDYNNNNDYSLSVFPNPTQNDCFIEFVTPKSNDVTIQIYDLSGKQIASSQNVLEEGKHKFELSGLKNGIYFVVVQSDKVQYSKQIISTSNSNEIPKITYLNSEIGSGEKPFKNSKAKVQMQFSPADRLLITLTSDINYSYSSVISVIPTGNMTITSNYIATTDGDNNNYPTVTIGNQIWMTENLRTKKYRNGDPITEVSSASSWGSLTTGAWCSYNNNPTIYTNYGLLYNFYAVSDSRKICPLGWHVPTDAEWDTLKKYLMNTGINATVSKRLAATTNWLPSTYNGAVGNTDYPTERNKTGFTAMPAGYRDETGTYGGEESYGQWWTSTECGNIDNDAWARNIYYEQNYLYRYGPSKEVGLSVRCVYGN